MSIERLKPDAAATLTQSATVTAAVSATQIFDLGKISTAYVTVTCLSFNLDGLTGGFSAGQILADIRAMDESRDGVLYPIATAGGGFMGWRQDDPQVGTGLPAVSHQAMIIASRYVRVVANVIDGSSFDPYVGPNNPSAVFRIDVEYV